MSARKYEPEPDTSLRGLAIDAAAKMKPRRAARFLLAFEALHANTPTPVRATLSSVAGPAGDEDKIPPHIQAMADADERAMEQKRQQRKAKD